MKPSGTHGVIVALLTRINLLTSLPESNRIFRIIILKIIIKQRVCDTYSIYNNPSYCILFLR